MIATSIEQSKRLIEAGIPKKSADMYWYMDSNISRTIPSLKEAPLPILSTNRESVLESPKFFSPVWSLSALWNYIHNLDKTYDFPTTLSADELIETLVNTIIYRLNERKAVDERSR